MFRTHGEALFCRACHLKLGPNQEKMEKKIPLFLWYRGFHEKGIFSVHSFNGDYLSIPERPGSYKYLFHEIPVMSYESKILLTKTFTT